MGCRRRIHFTDSRKAEIWDRRQRGESMRSIGHGLDRNSSSIFPLLPRTCAIRQLARARSRPALAHCDREEISGGLGAQRSFRAIARQLRRAPWTISRAVERNGGRAGYPEAKKPVINADCGGSNGVRVRLWKVELQKLADETGRTLQIHHYPPGTSKWNKIEYRLFCHITQNWSGRPLTDRMTVVELIGATTTKAGLRVKCAIDERTYQKGIKVSKPEMDALNITGDEFHPEWNYTIKPRTTASSTMSIRILSAVLFPTLWAGFSTSFP